MRSRTLFLARIVVGVVGAWLLVADPGVLAGQAGSPRALGFEIDNLDPAIRPQDDFYRYANGGWLRRTPIPGDRSLIGTFDVLRERAETALREILEEAAADRGAPAGSEMRKIGDFYASFLDSARVESLGVEPLRGELGRIAELDDRDALPELWAHLRRIGVQTPIEFSVAQDRKQADRYIVYVGQSGLGLPDRDYYFQAGDQFARMRTGYLRYVETLLGAVGTPDPASAARDILALETSLAEAHWERARNRDREATYNLMRVTDLQAAAPNFAWDRYIRALGAESTPAVVVRQPDYLEAVDRVIATTPLSTLRDYLTFKLLDEYAGALSSTFSNARFEFRDRILAGLEEQRPRWKRAVSATEGALGEAVGRVYVERHFPPEAMARMQALVDNLMVAFRQGIDELEWMSDATKREAQAKLASFNVKIGYPERWRDYSTLEVRRGDVIGNEMRANEFDFRRMVDRLGQPIDRNEWGMTPQTVNAYYSATLNEIAFPAGILQPPFFDPTVDDAVNYGAIGAVIGHEISHGFDDQGSRSDGEGNLRNWWTEADAAAFRERTTALAEQYSGYCPIDGLCVDGVASLGENIGDLSGLTMAYRAYQLALDGREAPVIDGFTGDQRFFIGWAQIWRTNYRDEALRQRVMTDPHSPNMYRTNGVVINIPEFHAAFGTQPGDAMYLPPEERVKVW